MDSPFDSVLLLAYGAPERMEDVRPFLDNVLRGLPVPKERYEAVVHHYELIGGKSPLNELTARQARGLAEALRADGLDLKVHIGMRSTGSSPGLIIRFSPRRRPTRSVERSRRSPTIGVTPRP